MKSILAGLFILVLGMHRSNANPIKQLSYNQSVAIVADAVKSIDSVWNGSKKKVRIIDNKNLFFPTMSWAYLDDKPPFVILNRFPYDFNSKSYLDLVIVKYEIKE